MTERIQQLERDQPEAYVWLKGLLRRDIADEVTIRIMSGRILDRLQA